MAIGSVNYGGGNAFPYGPPKGTIATTGEALNKLLTAIQQRKKDQYDKTLLYQLSETLGMTTNSQQNKRINDIAGNVNPGSVSDITAKDWENLDFGQLMGKMWNMINQDQTKDFIPDVMEQRLQGKGSYRGPTTQLETTLLNLALQEIQGQPSPAEKMKEMATIFANIKNAMTSERHAAVAEGNLELQGEQFEYNQGMDEKKLAMDERRLQIQEGDLQLRKDIHDSSFGTATRAYQSGKMTEKEYLSYITGVDLTHRDPTMEHINNLISSLQSKGIELTEADIKSLHGIATTTTNTGGGLPKGWWVDSNNQIRTDKADIARTSNMPTIQSIEEEVHYGLTNKNDDGEYMSVEDALVKMKKAYDMDTYHGTANQYAEDPFQAVNRELRERLENNILSDIYSLQLEGEPGSIPAYKIDQDAEGNDRTGMDIYEILYDDYNQTMDDLAKIGQNEFRWYLPPDKAEVASKNMIGGAKNYKVTGNPVEKGFIQLLYEQTKRADVNQSVGEIWNNMSDEDISRAVKELNKMTKQEVGKEFDFNPTFVKEIIKLNSDIAVNDKNPNMENMPNPISGQVPADVPQEYRDTAQRYRDSYMK